MLSSNKLLSRSQHVRFRSCDKNGIKKWNKKCNFLVFNFYWLNGSSHNKSSSYSRYKFESEVRLTLGVKGDKNKRLRRDMGRSKVNMSSLILNN